MIYIGSKKRKLEKIQAQYPGAEIIDATSNSDDPKGILLSPFYPHGIIPVPFSPKIFAKSVEGIWQGFFPSLMQKIVKQKFTQIVDEQLKETKNVDLSGLRQAIKSVRKSILLIGEK